MGKRLPKVTKNMTAPTWKGRSLFELKPSEIDMIRQKILKAWEMAMPDTMVLRYANISQEQYDLLLERFPEFAEMREPLYTTPRMNARMNVIRDIEKGNVNTSKWLLERTDPEFSKKGDGAVINVSVREREEELLKEIRKFGTADFTVVEENGESASVDEGEDTRLEALQEDSDE